MKLTRSDLRRLKWPIAGASVLVIVGAGCLMASDHFLSEARKAADAAKSQREQAQKRVEQVAEEERDIRSNLVYYNKMVQRGMASQENRLDLIDTIAQIKNQRRLYEIRYSIEPQKPLDYAGIRHSGAIDLVTSRMKLEMQLLHEGDLLDFLDDLTASNKAFISVRSCSVARLERSVVPSATLTPRLRSECQVDLIALKQLKPA
jgi:hypothetical protein